jgi:hypothetical protein
MIPKSFK